MRTVLIENTWLDSDLLDHGWGNGYVILPEGHRWHGMDYNDIPVNVHGGLTFAESADAIYHYLPLREDERYCWVIGFDTCHARDNSVNWTKERVQEEADRLLEQCM